MKISRAFCFSILIALLFLCPHLPAMENIPESTGAPGVQRAAIELNGIHEPPKGALQIVRVASAASTQTQSSAGEEESGWGIFLAIAGIFLLGIGLCLTPCVFPLIPITISYFGGQALGTDGKRGASILLHGVLYVIGLAAMNSLLGVFAALSGRLLGEVLQNPITLVVVAGVLLVFAFSMFGSWEFRLPQVVNRIASRNFAGYFGSFFIGLTLGFVAAPCLGPVVVSLLVWVASTGNPWVGFIYFFSLSLGMGVPLFVLALLSGRLTRLPRSGEWMLWVRKLMGWVLVGMAAYFVKPVLPDVLGIVLISLTALAAGIHLGWIEQSRAAFGAFAWIRKGVGILCIVIAVSFVWGGVAPAGGIKWRAYSEQAFTEAKNSGKPILIDFYADWCQPCLLMEKHTFQNSTVMELAEKDFVMLRVDLTRSGDPQKEKLARRYNILGIPTILFVGPDGKEREDLRVMEFMSPDRFLARMGEMKKLVSGSK